jgi:hypothetical protein
MGLPTRSEIMDSHHLSQELAGYLSKCTKQTARHWMESLGIQQDNSANASLPTFNSEVLKEFYGESRDVVKRLVRAYPSRSDLKSAVAEPEFVSRYTDLLLDRYASQIWGQPVPPYHERLCHTELSWDIEEDKDKFVDRVLKIPGTKANTSRGQDPGIPSVLDSQPSTQHNKEDNNTTAKEEIIERQRRRQHQASQNGC